MPYYQLNKEQSLYSIHFWLLMSFSMSFIYSIGLSSFLIVCLTILSLIILIKTKDQKLLNNVLLYYSFFMFFVLLVGLINTDNYPRSFTILEKKLSFLATPIALAPVARYMTKMQLRKILITFSASCLIGVLICLGIACFIYLTKGENAFVYSAFSRAIGIHPAYFSIMLIFSFFINCLFLADNYEGHRKRYKVSFGIVLFAQFFFIIFLKARMPLFVFSILLLILFVILLKNKKFRLKAITLLLICGLGSGLLITQDKFIRYRLFNSVKLGFDNRLALWNAGYQVAKCNIWLGVGTGDVMDELLKKYKEHNLSEQTKLQYNVHNEFLQTIIRNGLIGLFILMAYMLFLIIYAFKKKSYLLFVLTFSNLLFFLTENVLSTQKGIVFFSFFSFLIYYELENNRQKSSKDAAIDI